jgi:hypothetical protein
MGTPARFIAARAFSFSPLHPVTSGGGVNRVNVGDFSRADYRRDIEITQRQLRRPDADSFVGKTHVQRITVSFAINGHGADAQLLAGTDDPQGNLSAIGDQDFLEHELIGKAKNFYHRGTETPRKARTEKTSLRNSIGGQYLDYQHREVF